MRLLPLLPALALALPAARAFVFSYTAPTSCDPLTILWENGTAPFSLLITPSLDVARNITLPSSSFSTSTNRGNYTLPLQLNAGGSFLLTMSDATGFGTGGTSALLVVGASITGASCDTAGPPLGFEFFLQSGGASECKPFEISWQANATLPVEIWGLIPLGQTFTLGPQQGTTFDWTVNVQTGTSFFLVLADAAGNQGGTSSIQSVGSSDDSSCINGNSPSSTINAQPVQTSVPSTTPSSTPAPAESHTGAIIGGVVGGILALVALLLLLAFFWRRHQKRAAEASSPTTYKRTQFGGGMIDLLPNPSQPDLPRMGSYNNGQQQYEPVPFVVPPLEDTGSTDGFGSGSETNGLRNPFDNPGTRSGTRSGSASNSRSMLASTTPTTTTDATLGHGGPDPTRAPSGAFLAPGAAAGSRAAKRAEARANAAPEVRRYVLHTDAGSVLESEEPEPDEEAVVELPPAYDPSFASRRTTQTDFTGTGGTGRTLGTVPSGETLRAAGAGEMGERTSGYGYSHQAPLQPPPREP
ncbi:hypothetical protein CALVIDRAFT_533299 [Calocera viscosa TUFC12733]|uniref:Epidermal growth factor receptor-like transmembrane-juxtamembrane segment domain-containing protein n=1 Tax=Calocera viscosa (strain TUFC12733) TaxID=1330018 RepID=A0A167RJG5_CALVF|nr:hypothetical protein CALVIDRAFT_533299 [Calocera viscosa TUFC12733]